MYPYIFFIMIPPPPRSTLFPYTTLFRSDEVQEHPRYNIAPTQPVLIVRKEQGKKIRHFTTMRWGLIPSWAKDMSIGNRDRKSTRLNSSHSSISYAVFCLKKKIKQKKKVL